ncbi:MAG: zf-HC2 domain-containing protein [Acidobacteria bacterium]|nr:zf-HC2 domain-containing protein [Acidobacteriota bacterium]MCA1641121.1 zf-HC2 domain-containing protein [Acidobacteriota bacterium]
MDCAEYLSLLSDYRDGSLDDGNRSRVSQHLDGCPPCKCVFTDIETIVTTASGFRAEDGISYPDEETFWQRITVTARTIH